MATTLPRGGPTIVRSELVGSPFQTSGSWLRWAPPWRCRGGASVEWVRRPLPQSDFFYEHVLAAHGLPPLLGTPSKGCPRPGFGGYDSLFRRLTCPMTYPSHRGEKVSHPRRLRPDVVCAAPRAPGIAPRRGDPRRPGAHPRAEGVPYHPGPGPDPRRLRELPPPARLDARHAHAALSTTRPDRVTNGLAARLRVFVGHGVAMERRAASQTRPTEPNRRHWLVSRRPMGCPSLREFKLDKLTSPRPPRGAVRHLVTPRRKPGPIGAAP